MMIEQVLIISLVVWGIWKTYRPGEILNGFANTMKKVLPKALHKPILYCCGCMVPYYGIPIYLLTWGFNYKMFVVIIASIGLNTIVGFLCAINLSIATLTDILSHEFYKNNSHTQQSGEDSGSISG